MSDTTQLNTQSAISEITARYEALVRDFGLLRQLEAIDTESMSCDEACRRTVGLIALEGIAEYCSIMLLNSEGTYLELRAVSTRYSSEGFAIGSDMWHGKKFALGEGIAGRVAASGRHVRIADTHADPNYLKLPDSPVEIRSLMCFPLVYREELLGVLNLSHGRAGYFDVDREHAMVLIAQKIARAIHPGVQRSRLLNGDDSEGTDGECAPEVLAVFDGDGRIVQITGNCVQLTQFSADEWIADTVRWRSRVAVVDRAAYEAYYDGMDQCGENKGVSYTFTGVTGGDRRLHEMAVPLPEACGLPGGYVAYIQDEAKKEILTHWSSGVAASKLLHAQRIHTMGQLAGGIVHDMNNLLTGIVGNLDLALITDPDTKSRDLVAQARKASIRGAEIVNKVLNFSRAGVGDGALETISAPRVVQEAADILRCSLDARIELEVAIPEETMNIRGDSGELLQVLINLGVNARDALEQRGPGASSPTTMKLGAERVCFDQQSPGPWGGARQGKFVRLYVYDNGVGMNAEVLSRMYEPFYSTKAAGRGTGLGLSTVYRIVQRHQGWVDVQSTPQVGTTFNIYLPACEGPERESARPVASEPTGGSEMVLLVDDEPLVRNLGGAILKRLGYDVLIASTGQEAVDKYRCHARQIDVVILDLQLPDMGGEKVLQKLREIQPDLPIVYSSGMSEMDMARIPESLKPTAFLKKPYLIATMAEVIRQALRPQH